MIMVPPASTSNNVDPLLSFTRNNVPSLKLSLTSNTEFPVEVLAIDNLPVGTEVPIPTEILESSKWKYCAPEVSPDLLN